VSTDRATTLRRLNLAGPAAFVLALATAAVSSLTVSPSSSGREAAAPPYTVEPAPYTETPRFVVRYAGSGTYETRYRAKPPNPGGARDLNIAHDKSTQAWRLTFGRTLSVPPCGESGAADPCTALAGLTGALGPSSVTARIVHTHVDGLYRQLDATDKCTLRASASRTDASIDLRYDAVTKTIKVGARNPVRSALLLLRGYCPKRPDGIDRLRSNYASPGFSFSGRYDADRWFRSRVIAVPADVFHRAKTIRIPFGDTPTGRPPRNCAVRRDWFERCTTGGSWRGTLTLARTP
jgi:hypothetical protein